MSKLKFYDLEYDSMLVCEPDFDLQNNEVTLFTKGEKFPIETKDNNLGVIFLEYDSIPKSGGTTAKYFYMQKVYKSEPILIDKGIYKHVLSYDSGHYQTEFEFKCIKQSYQQAKK